MRTGIVKEKRNKSGRAKDEEKRSGHDALDDNTTTLARMSADTIASEGGSKKKQKRQKKGKHAVDDDDDDDESDDDNGGGRGRSRGTAKGGDDDDDTSTSETVLVRVLGELSKKNERHDAVIALYAKLVKQYDLAALDRFLESRPEDLFEKLEDIVSMHGKIATSQFSSASLKVANPKTSMSGDERSDTLLTGTGLALSIARDYPRSLEDWGRSVFVLLSQILTKSVFSHAVTQRLPTAGGALPSSASVLTATALSEAAAAEAATTDSSIPPSSSDSPPQRPSSSSPTISVIPTSIGLNDFALRLVGRLTHAMALCLRVDPEIPDAGSSDCNAGTTSSSTSSSSSSSGDALSSMLTSLQTLVQLLLATAAVAHRNSAEVRSSTSPSTSLFPRASSTTNFKPHGGFFNDDDEHGENDDDHCEQQQEDENDDTHRQAQVREQSKASETSPSDRGSSSKRATSSSASVGGGGGGGDEANDNDNDQHEELRVDSTTNTHNALILSHITGTFLRALALTCCSLDQAKVVRSMCEKVLLLYVGTYDSLQQLAAAAAAGSAIDDAAADDFGDDLATTPDRGANEDDDERNSGYNDDEDDDETDSTDTPSSNAYTASDKNSAPLSPVSYTSPGSSGGGSFGGNAGLFRAYYDAISGATESVGLLAERFPTLFTNATAPTTMAIASAVATPLSSGATLQFPAGAAAGGSSSSSTTTTSGLHIDAHLRPWVKIAQMKAFGSHERRRALFATLRSVITFLEANSAETSSSGSSSSTSASASAGTTPASAGPYLPSSSSSVSSSVTQRVVSAFCVRQGTPSDTISLRNCKIRFVGFAFHSMLLPLLRWLYRDGFTSHIAADATVRKLLDVSFPVEVAGGGGGGGSKARGGGRGGGKKGGGRKSGGGGDEDDDDDGGGGGGIGARKTFELERERHKKDIENGRKKERRGKRQDLEMD